MHHLIKATALSTVGLAALLATPSLAQTRAASTQAPAQMSTLKRPHRVIIQVTQNDAAVMNMALNNAENLAKFYKDRGEQVQIEIVTYGAGLNMVRSDTSPVKERLAALVKSKNITIDGCANTMAAQSKQEDKQIALVPEAHIVPAGISRVVELEEQGWTYVRP